MIFAVAATVLALLVPAGELSPTDPSVPACAGEEVLQSPLEAPAETEIVLLSHDPCGSLLCGCCDRCYERCAQACFSSGGLVFQCLKNCEDDWNFCMAVCEAGSCPP